MVDVARAAAGVGAASGELVDQRRLELDGEAVAGLQATGQLLELEFKIALISIPESELV